MLLALVISPRTLTGHGARLTGNTPVNVEYGCKLPFGSGFKIGILHASPLSASYVLTSFFNPPLILYPKESTIAKQPFPALQDAIE